jgi:predicted RecA/RadA family phage recombinase
MGDVIEGGGEIEPGEPGGEPGSGGSQMSTTKFVHEGAAIDYTPGADIPAGTVVVQGDLVGTTRVDLKANQLGSLAVQGVFDFPKAAGAGTAFTVGTLAYWDATNKVATKTASGNKVIGKAVRAAADADTTVRIRMSQ